MEKILALYDKDESYAARFARYVQGRKQFPFSLYTFTELDSLQRFAGRREIDVLLTAEAGDGESLMVGARDVVHLAENSLAEADAGKHIYKYQSGDAILRELMSFYGNAGSAQVQHGREAEAIMVFSPLGRCGKTCLALGLAKMLSREKRTLYVSFEEVSWLLELTGQVQRNSLTEALYYFKEDALDAMKLKTLVYADGDLDYIAPVRNPADLSALSAEELGRFLSDLKKLGGYDVLVVDTDAACGRCAELFRRCKRILIPSGTDAVSEQKLGQFRAFIDRNGDGNIKHRFRSIQAPMYTPDFSKAGLRQFTQGAFASFLSEVIRNHIYDGEEAF